MNKYFLQFYEVHHTRIELMNGFSETWDYVSSIGDMVWMNDKDKELKINDGEVFVCCYYTHQLYKVYNWALENPHMKFVVGGPVMSTYYEIRGELPENLKVTRERVETYFGLKNFECNWGLEIPQEAIEEAHVRNRLLHGSSYNNDIFPTLYFSYALDNRCFWDNCTFCSFPTFNNIMRKDLNYEYKDIVEYPGTRLVHFGTSALMPRQINILNEIPKDFNHITFMRATDAEYNQLIKTNGWDNVEFKVGLEYPTDRMWERMGKGFKKESCLKTLELLEGHTHLTSIVGWNDLTKEDLNELEDFMKKLPKAGSDFGSGKKTWNIYGLFCCVGTDIYGKYDKLRDEDTGPFHYGYWPTISKQQEEYSMKSAEIMSSYASEKGYDVSIQYETFHF